MAHRMGRMNPLPSNLTGPEQRGVQVGEPSTRLRPSRHIGRRARMIASEAGDNDDDMSALAPPYPPSPPPPPPAEPTGPMPDADGNLALARASWAGGRASVAEHELSFVWGAGCRSTAPRQVTFGCPGGFRVDGAATVAGELAAAAFRCPAGGTFAVHGPSGCWASTPVFTDSAGCEHPMLARSVVVDGSLRDPVDLQGRYALSVRGTAIARADGGLQIPLGERWLVAVQVSHDGGYRYTLSTTTGGAVDGADGGALDAPFLRLTGGAVVGHVGTFSGAGDGPTGTSWTAIVGGGAVHLTVDTDGLAGCRFSLAATRL